MEDIVQLYVDGLSIPQIAEIAGMSRSTVRRRLKAASVLRRREDAIRLAGVQGRLGSGLRGKRRVFSDTHRENISKARLEWADKFAKGQSVKPTGYAEFTRGPNKGRLVHVVLMEEKIGRRILPGECVHHIDGDPLNNSLGNLAFMTLSTHASLHRKQDIEAGKIRKRKKNGRFS